MADTIREKILDNIKTTLEGISVANGYVNNIASVQRWEQEGNPLVSVPCIIINAGQEEKKQVPGLLTDSVFSVIIDLWVRHDKSVFAGSTDSYLSTFDGDIEKALMVDYTRGGYAKNTNIVSVIPFETAEGQPYAGLIFNIEIPFVHKAEDPTQQ